MIAWTGSKRETFNFCPETSVNVNDVTAANRAVAMAMGSCMWAAEAGSGAKALTKSLVLVSNFGPSVKASAPKP